MAGYLGIDVGGSKVALRVEGNGAQPRESTFRWPSAADASQDWAVLTRTVEALRDRWRQPIEAVGVAMPATLDEAGRVVAWPGRPSWAGLEINAALRELFPEATVRCADDGDLAAIAEADRARCPNLVYLGVGTGIGGGIVLDGRPIPGPARGSCEIGHVIVDLAGPRCDCGRRGCVQAVASGPATLRRATELRGSRVGFDELRDGLAECTPWAISAVKDSCAALATAVVGLCELVRPDLVLIGGGFAAEIPDYVTTVAAHARRLAREGSRPVPLRPAVLGGRSSLYGALLLARGLCQEAFEAPQHGRGDEPRQRRRGDETRGST